MNPYATIAVAVAITSAMASLAVSHYSDSQAYQTCVEHHSPDECDHNNYRLVQRLGAYKKCVEHHSPQECK